MTQNNNKKQVPFAALPLDHVDIIQSLGKGLLNYWISCWRTDSFGNTFVPVKNANLKSTTESKYRKMLERLGLFAFEVRIVCKQRYLWVRNLFGSKSADFKNPYSYVGKKNEQSLDLIEQVIPPIEDEKAESIVEQEFQLPSRSIQNRSKITTTIEETPAVAFKDFFEEGEKEAPMSLAEVSKIKLLPEVTFIDIYPEEMLLNQIEEEFQASIVAKKLTKNVEIEPPSIEKETLALIESELNVSILDTRPLVKLIKSNTIEVIKNAIAYTKKKAQNTVIVNILGYLTTAINGKYREAKAEVMSKLSNKTSSEFLQAYDKLIAAGIVKNFPIASLNIRNNEYAVCVIDETQPQGFFDEDWRTAMKRLVN